MTGLLDVPQFEAIQYCPGGNALKGQGMHPGNIRSIIEVSRTFLIDRRIDYTSLDI
jgi:hypothetical protein